MVQIAVSELQRTFGEAQHQARREPVEIKRHGRREFVLMSAEHYDWLTAAAKRTHRTADAAFRGRRRGGTGRNGCGAPLMARDAARESAGLVATD